MLGARLFAVRLPLALQPEKSPATGQRPAPLQETAALCPPLSVLVFLACLQACSVSLPRLTAICTLDILVVMHRVSLMWLLTAGGELEGLCPGCSFLTVREEKPNVFASP